MYGTRRLLEPKKTKNRMPIYAYQCSECDYAFEIHHSMKEILEDCEECKTSGSLVRIPSLGFINTKPQSNNKVGSLVQKHIEEGRREIRKEKEDMKSEIEVEPKQ